MTDFNIEIIEQPSYSLEVAVGASGTDVPSIEIITSGGVYLEISNRDKILPSDFPDTYPISSTTGLLPISRVSGLYAGSGIIFSSGINGSIIIQGQTQSINITGVSGISVSQNGNLYTIYTTGTFGLSSSQIQSLLNSGVSINVISGTGNFNSLSISGTPVSISGHSHTSSSITDFNSSVSGLLSVKNILGSGYASVASSGGVFTVSVTGLQPSGNYSISGHIHTSSQITDFNTSVNSLVSVKNVSGSGYVNVLATTGNYIVYVTGLQPSGNYSLVGHNHTSSDITNFNSSVSGLLPITNIVGTSGASVTSSGTVFTVAVTGSFGLTTSQIQSLLNSGVSISVTGGTGNFNSLSVNSIPVSTSGHTHLSSSIIDFNSATSGLLTPYALLNSGNFTTLLVTGIPVSLSGHTHTSSQITDFNTSVNNLISVKDILPGSGIQIGVTSGIYTVTAYDVAASSASSLITRCENRTGSTLPKMTVVYINGGQGNRPTIQKSIASNEGGSSKTYGITASQINDNSAGDVVVFGALIDVDTNQFGATEGSTLYLSPSVSGNLTAIKPTAPNHMVAVGKIVRNHVNQGIIEVSIQNGFELEELHNVATTGAISGQFLKYDGSLWRNSGITSSDIGNFNSSVSGLLTPYAQLNDALFNNLSVDTLFVCNTPSFNVDEDGNTSIGNNNPLVGVAVPNLSVVYGLSFASGIASSGLNVFNYLRLNNTGVSLSGHKHIASDITNFNTSVSGLLPPVSGSGYAVVLLSNNIYTVSITGLQPSGNYSVSGHAHTASNITDFNSATSGLLLPYALLNSGNFTTLLVTGTPVSLSGHTHISSQITDFNSSVSGLLPFTGVLGSGNINISSSNRILNISTTGLQPSGNYSVSGHTHLTSDISNFASGVSGLLPVVNIIPGANISISSISGIYTINSSAGGGGGGVSVSNPGSGRVLTSDGTSSGIIGQSGLTFSNNSLFINGVNVNNARNLYMWSNFR